MNEIQSIHSHSPSPTISKWQYDITRTLNHHQITEQGHREHCHLKSSSITSVAAQHTYNLHIEQQTVMKFILTSFSVGLFISLKIFENNPSIQSLVSAFKYPYNSITEHACNLGCNGNLFFDSYNYLWIECHT